MPRTLVLIALASLAVTAAGCGSKPVSSGVAQLPGSTTTTSSQNNGSEPEGSTAGSPARYSACMRSHGVPKFPDPQTGSGGGVNLTIGPGSGIDPSSPQFKAAQKACEKLMPGGKGSASPAQQAKAQAQMLKFSACMRSHGLPNFPDPTFSGGGVQLSIGGRDGLNPKSPVFQAAQKACEKVMPAPPDGGKRVNGTASGATSKAP